MSLLTLLAPTATQLQIPTLWAALGVRLSVEVAFRSAPLAEVLLWEDITAYVRDIQITRGRSKELDRFQPSTCVLTVENTGRLFDPEYTAGTWYGYIKPNRAVRVRAQYAGVEYPVWQGFVDEWPQDYVGMSFATVQIPCSDAFALLANRRLNAPFDAEVQADIDAGQSPYAWWRLDELTGTSAADEMGGTALTYTGTYTLGEDALLSGPTTTTSVFFPNGGGTSGYATATSAVPQSYPLCVEFLIRGTEMVAAGSTVIFRIENQSGTTLMSLFYSVFLGEPLELHADNSITKYATDLGDGSVHHVAVVFTTNGIVTVYVDGAAVSPSSSAGGAGGIGPGIPSRIRVGGISTSDGINAWMDEIVVWDYAPSAARIAARADAALGWSGDTTAERVSHLLDSVGWPDTLRDIGTGSTTCAALSSTATSVLDALMTLTDTEQGHCYVDGQGRIVFRGRTELATDDRSANSQATFGDS